MPHRSDAALPVAQFSHDDDLGGAEDDAHADHLRAGAKHHVTRGRTASSRARRGRVVGLGALVVVSDPRLIRELFAGDPDVLFAGQATAASWVAFLVQAPCAFSTALGICGCAACCRLPCTGRRCTSTASSLGELATAEVAKWPVGKVSLQLHPRMRAIALEMILRTVIGARSREPHTAAGAAAAGRTRDERPRVGGESTYPSFAETVIARRLPGLRARQRADRLLYEELAAHRSDAVRDDVLGLLIAARDDDGEPLSDEALRDQLVTLLVSGPETAAAALAW